MRKILLLLILTILTFTLSACFLFRDIHTFELIDMDHDNEILAYIHKDDWQGEFPTLRTQERLTLTANIVSKNLSNRTLDEEGAINGISVSVLEGSRDDVISIENNGDHVVLRAINQGITELEFHWIHEGEIVYTTPPIYLMVYNSGLEQEISVLAFEILDLNNNSETTAYVHGAHWHGSLPRITIGGSLDLSAFIMNEHQEEVIFDDNGVINGLQVSLATGANENIISIENHGNHVVIHGLNIGTTQVVFKWMLDGVTHYTTPPITVRVIE
ncbi:hypothetical protein [Liberiplasma polymorphum]|uniref:hypothetical protein n=1 Tax=Liberiplasma polymorphum TaxID=3374570 RepID=UPI003773B034